MEELYTCAMTPSVPTAAEALIPSCIQSRVSQLWVMSKAFSQEGRSRPIRGGRVSVGSCVAPHVAHRQVPSHDKDIGFLALSVQCVRDTARR